MRFSVALFSVFTFLAPPALIVTFLLYLYPVFLGCDFPPPSKPQTSCYPSGDTQQQDARAAIPDVAPFRLLVFGDPQLEGDSSLPNPDDPAFPSLRRLGDLNRNYTLQWNADLVFGVGRELFREDIPLLLWSYRKRLDLLGNDFYLAHIYRTLHWYLRPTHVAVLGDLLGSQWVSDAEFEIRGHRFWDRVFRRGRRVEDAITHGAKRDAQEEDAAWDRRIINIAGNHDIGYAGDITEHRVERFERVFGRANWDIKFTFPQTTNATGHATTPSSFPELRLVILNSMNLDGPAQSPILQQATYDFINNVIPYTPITDRTTATIILTHIPLHKEPGICVDGSLFTHHPDGTIHSQNHLSRQASLPILEGILGMSGNPFSAGGGQGRKGIVLAGHDHEGCDVYHHIPADVERDGTEWRAVPWDRTGPPLDAGRRRGPGSVPGVREITVRSMMGSFGGNAGMLSAWFDSTAGEWRFEYASCAVGVQHIWWGVHVLDLVTVLLLLCSGLVRFIERPVEPPKKRKRGETEILRAKREVENGSMTPPSWPNGSVEKHGVKRSRSKSVGTPRHRSSARRKREET